MEETIFTALTVLWNLFLTKRFRFSVLCTQKRVLGIGKSGSFVLLLTSVLTSLTLSVLYYLA